MIRLLLAASLLLSLAQAQPPDLRVAPDHRHLETAEGKPFFLLGDTAWELFHRLTREEAEDYLKNRADKGFNTILAVALAEYEFDKPNAYGEMPLENNDPTKPRDAYFQHVDWIVNKAASLGLYTAMLPTWGDKWNKKWGKGPEIFTPENAAIYGEWLGRRYADKPIIWILGGDRPIGNDYHRDVVRALAAGLKKGDGGKHLISYHPSGTRNSSEYWPDEPWLDFHMFQSGHGKRAAPNYKLNENNLALRALKPTLDGEPNYEDHPVRGLMKNGKPTEWFDDYDARRAAWWSLLSGACGHVYGTHSIWQFHDPEKRTPVTDARTPWRKAMDLPGAVQMGVLKRFFETTLPDLVGQPEAWTKLRPVASFVRLNGAEETPATHPVSAIADDGSFAVAYLPQYQSGGILPDLQKLKVPFDDLLAMSCDPATGELWGMACTVSGVAVYNITANSLDPHPKPLPRDWVAIFCRKPN